MSEIVEDLRRYQFSLVRILLSIYLSYFFISMWEQRELVEALAGSQSQILHIFLLALPILALTFSIILFFGYFVSYISMGLLICYQLEFILLPIPKEVQGSYLSIILIIFSLFAKRDKRVIFFSTQFKDVSSWNLALFLAVYFGFTVSGLSKLFFRPWLNGEVIDYFCTTSQIGNIVGTSICSALPKTAVGYFVLFVETMSFPLAMLRRTRSTIWFLNTCLHIVTPIFLYVWPVSFGVWLIQMTLFDFCWLESILFNLRRVRSLPNNFE